MAITELPQSSIFVCIGDQLGWIYQEYKLTGLLPMSRYFVLVQGEKDGHYRSIVTTEFITGIARYSIYC